MNKNYIVIASNLQFYLYTDHDLYIIKQLNHIRYLFEDYNKSLK